MHSVRSLLHNKSCGVEQIPDDRRNTTWSKISTPAPFAYKYSHCIDNKWHHIESVSYIYYKLSKLDRSYNVSTISDCDVTSQPKSHSAISAECQVKQSVLRRQIPMIWCVTPSACICRPMRQIRRVAELDVPLATMFSCVSVRLSHHLERLFELPPGPGEGPRIAEYAAPFASTARPSKHPEAAVQIRKKQQTD